MRAPRRIGAILSVLALGLVSLTASCADGSSDARTSGTDARATTSSAAPDTSTTVVSTVEPTSTTTSEPRWPVDTAPSSGCFAPRQLLPGTTHWPFDQQGVARSYVMVVGESVDPDVPNPLIFALHGLGSDGATLESYARFAPEAEELGAVVVAPDALPPDRGWSDADLPFLASVLDDVEATHCIDRNRVWVAGLSLGGFMAARLACELPGRFAAVGAVAGFGFDPGRCEGVPPIPVLLFHGTADAVVPYAGTPPSFAAFVPSRGAEGAAADWAAHNACDASPLDTEIGTEVTRRTWSGCVAAVELYTVVGGGHSWPGAVPVVSQGYTTAQISATALLADHFAAHRLDVG